MLSITEAAELLYRLLQKELISISSSREPWLIVIPSLSDIIDELEKPDVPGSENRWYYKLTQKGIDLWEIMARPCWEKYIILFYHPKEPLARAIAQNRDRIEQILYSPYNPKPPKIGTECWQEVIRWHPTYWKTLPFGYLVTYQYQSINQDTKGQEWHEHLESYCQERDTWFSQIPW